MKDEVVVIASAASLLPFACYPVTVALFGFFVRLGAFVADCPFRLGVERVDFVSLEQPDALKAPLISSGPDGREKVRKSEEERKHHDCSVQRPMEAAQKSRQARRGRFVQIQKTVKDGS
jgi:hypothetical protein